YMAFPREHWTRLRTNNMLERLMKEIRRRTRVVGAFPDGESALMLVAARLRHVAGTKWGSRPDLDMDKLRDEEKAAAGGGAITPARHGGGRRRGNPRPRGNSEVAEKRMCASCRTLPLLRRLAACPYSGNGASPTSFRPRTATAPPPAALPE